MLKFGIQVRPNCTPTEFVEHLRFVEKEGFDYAWIDDIGLHRETFILCALASERTTKLRIGPGVTNPYTRHPGMLAAQVATLQEISNGRSFLGLGLGGYTALRQLGFTTWNKPVNTLREAIMISRRLLDGENLTFDGSIFKLTNAKIDFRPKQRVPIYLGVMLGKQGLKMAGELCDGALVVGPLGRNQTRPVVDSIRKAAADSGKDPESLEIAMAAPFSVSDNRTEAIELAKQSVAERAILDERLRPAILAEGLTEEQISKVKNAAMRGDSLHEVVTDAMVDLFAIAGTVTDCIRKIEALKKTGITQLAVGRPARESPEMLKIIGEEIIPNVR